jgi:hypothetical protein
MIRRIEARLWHLGLMLLLFLLAALIGTIVVGVLNSNLIYGEDNQYGRVRIPGTKVLNLPAGDVQVSAAAAVPGRGNATPSFLIPKNLTLSVEPVSSGAKPTITQDIGGSENANDDQVDTQRRVWRVSTPAAGDYRVHAGGNFTGFGVNPQLWFGYQPGWAHGGQIPLYGAILGLIGIAVYEGKSRLRNRVAEADPS